MLLRHPFVPDAFLLFEQHVFAGISAFRQRRDEQPEAGGLLLGLRRGLHLHVTGFTPPQPRDLRMRHSFRRFAYGHQDIARKAWKETTARGAISYLDPIVSNDEDGEVILSGIHLYGDTVHIFVERKNYKGIFLPGYKKWELPNFKTRQTGLQHIDHCVGNVGWNQMNRWVKFYEEVMGFKNILTFDDEDISTEYSALMSKVMSNGNGFVKFPINEPAEGKKKSQVEEYLEFYNGEGVQHIAMATNDIVSTVRDLMSRGVEFLRVPTTYYDDLLDRVGHIDEDLKPLKELGILVDRDNEGYLLQLFSKPVEDRPTLFFEIIQRKGAKSFGKGNFKALFEAMEREQAARGNL